MMGSPDIMAVWDEMCWKATDYDALVLERDAALRHAETLHELVYEIYQDEDIADEDEEPQRCLYCGHGREYPRQSHDPRDHESYCWIVRAGDAILAAAPPAGEVTGQPEGDSK